MNAIDQTHYLRLFCRDLNIEMQADGDNHFLLTRKPNRYGASVTIGSDFVRVNRVTADGHGSKPTVFCTTEDAWPTIMRLVKP